VLAAIVGRPPGNAPRPDLICKSPVKILNLGASV